MENDVQSITLTDEEGKEVEFDVITKLDMEGKEYLIVVPKDSEDEDAIALRIDKDENGMDVLATVDDDDEFALVSEAFDTLFSEDDELN